MPRDFSYLDRWNEDLGVLGLNSKIFIPLCALSGQIADCAFPEGDGPLDFLSDIRRAGPLYEDSCYTAEKTIIRGIRRVVHYKHFSDIVIFVCVLAPQPPTTILIMYREHSELFRCCRPSQALLHELKTFQLSMLCHLSAADPQMHSNFHAHANFEDWFDQIIKWFWVRSFPLASQT
jgi:hypothetical protein